MMTKYQHGSQTVEFTRRSKSAPRPGVGGRSTPLGSAWLLGNPHDPGVP